VLFRSEESGASNAMNAFKDGGNMNTKAVNFSSSNTQLQTQTGGGLSNWNPPSHHMHPFALAPRNVPDVSFLQL